MSETVDASAGSERGIGLLAAFLEAGYVRAEPPVLQPASVFLDQSGEDIRGRLYLTSDAGGGDLCLRPEFTIPVFRLHLASGARGPAAYSYLGPVFRLRADGPGEFLQAGVESFGRMDRPAADAEILALTLRAAQDGGARGLSTRIGDAGLFSALLDALSLPEAWKRRIRRGHARGQSLEAMLASPNGRGGFEHAGVLAALANADRAEARALVEDLLSIAGISSVGGRSPSEIAERFLEQASAKDDAGVRPDQREALRRFLDIAGSPDDGALALRALADEAGLDLTAAIEEFEARLNFLAARGLDLARMTFSTRFGRRLDYYTGFVFEAADPARPDLPVLGGGRYDRLARSLGAGDDIPAVGASIWCERLVGGAGGQEPLR